MTEFEPGIEGQLIIRLKHDHQCVLSVDIHSSRPLQASRILIGKTPQQVLQIIPSLYSVCAVAQSRAALACLQQALQIIPEAKAEQARDVLLLAETAREHFLRIQLDWPPLFGQVVRTDGLPWVSRLVNEFKNALFEQEDAFSLENRMLPKFASAKALIDELEEQLRLRVFGCSLPEWLKIDSIDSLRKWAEQCDSPAALSLSMICLQGWTSQGVSSCPRLPWLEHHELQQQLSQRLADAFIEQPVWQSVCQDTSVLGRQMQQPLVRLMHREFHNSLITRWVARLVELAQLPQMMRDCLQPSGGVSMVSYGQGISQLEAVRGRLIHRVVLTDDRVSEYQIVAPTEWNFHPQGVLAQSLKNLSPRDEQELDLLARLVVNAIDPCVGFHIKLLQADG